MTSRIQEQEPLTTTDVARRTEGDQSVPEETEHYETVFSPGDLENFRTRWREIQSSFVDEPQQSVERGDELVATVIRRLTEVFADEHTRLEAGLSGDTSTETLRQALRRYRWFFDRLLSV